MEKRFTQQELDRATMVDNPSGITCEFNSKKGLCFLLGIPYTGFLESWYDVETMEHVFNNLK